MLFIKCDKGALNPCRWALAFATAKVFDKKHTFLEVRTILLTTAYTTLML